MEGIVFSALKEQPHRDKPPDKGNGGGTPTSGTTCSFCDKLMGNKQANPRREKIDLIAA